MVRAWSLNSDAFNFIALFSPLLVNRINRCRYVKLRETESWNALKQLGDRQNDRARPL